MYLSISINTGTVKEILKKKNDRKKSVLQFMKQHRFLSQYIIAFFENNLKCLFSRKNISKILNSFFKY